MSVINGKFWQLCSGVLVALLSITFVYGIFKIQALEVKNAAQDERILYLGERIGEMRAMLVDIQDNQEKIAIAFVQAQAGSSMVRP